MKKYILAMFPYPSGLLHMGHLRVYTIADVLSRFHKTSHPIGWDSFGLPAENAARFNNKDPEEWTNQNISQMKNQLQKMNINFDWKNELRTSDPKYYKWTQHIFLKLYEKGLVYQKESIVNWDPVDQTVLANEQVISGRGERSGALVEKKYLKQWYFKITEYADRLYRDLNDLDWPEAVKIQQRNWIKPKTGRLVRFDVQGAALDCFASDSAEFGLFISIGPQHSLVKELLDRKEVEDFVNKLVLDSNSAKEVNGVFTGLYASNDEFKNIPIHITNFMNDDIEGCQLGNPNNPNHLKYIRKHRFKCTQNLNGTYPAVTKYQLRDWLVSRQRLWGTPIPIIHCISCKSVPIPEADLPLKLQDKQKTPKCPRCNKDAQYESDTMDTFVDSSWYWIRFLDSHNEKELVSKEKLGQLPVDIYIGGIEHSIMHLLYARFIAKFLTDIKLIDIPNGEPFKKLLTQGMVTGITFKCSNTHRYIPSSEIEYADNQPRIKATASPVKVTFEKMSKSKFNGVNPHHVIQQYGTDVTRLFILYKAPPQDDLAWDSTAIVGMQRFLNRVQELVTKPKAENLEQDQKANLSISQVALTNLAITELLKLSSSLQNNFSTEAYKRLLEMLSIFTPETAARLYELVEPGKKLEFPKPTIVTKEQNVYKILVNGKQVHKAQLSNTDENELEKTVLTQLGITNHKKIIINKTKMVVNVLI
ncbi:hypothetical protein HDV06_006975 [Boothiomyces sp. JEL0866]|nr:hypothetical protein HDV06_006975 [Boothiomyces sp. JEL0866]